MLAVLLLITTLLLTASITGVVFAVSSAREGRSRRGLLTGCVVVGVLALASVVLQIPALIDASHLQVIVIEP